MKVIEEKNERGQITHFKGSDGYEQWKEYDENGNVMHYKDNSNEFWYEYDENGNVSRIKSNKEIEQ